MSLVFTDAELDAFVARALKNKANGEYEEYPDEKKTWTKSLKRALGLWKYVAIVYNDGEIRIYKVSDLGKPVPYLAVEDNWKKIPRALVIAWLKENNLI